MSSMPMSMSSSLKKILDPPVHCPQRTSILSAALLMKERRTHCLLVIDELSGKLIGLSTTKDLAFKAVAAHLPLDTSISHVMTNTPFYVSHRTSPTDALKFMVEKKIRHLPVVDENESVIGILNITTCFYNAMIRLERLSDKCKELQLTFNDLKNEPMTSPTHLTTVSNTSSSMTPIKIPAIKIRDHNDHLLNANQLDICSLNEGLMDLDIVTRQKRIANDIKNLISMMKQPDLKSLFNDNELNARLPFCIDAKTTIWDASQLLLQNNITAALIVQSTNIDYGNVTQIPMDSIIGILTTKDLVYRVLACQIDSKLSTVARVMTPKPDFASDTMAIHDALRLMYEGKYLNLPIKNENNQVTGLTNVLDLTYSLINVLNDSSHNFVALHDDDVIDQRFSKTSSLQDTSSSNTSSHTNVPAWNRFWDSLERPLNHSLSSSNLRRSFSSIDKTLHTQRSSSFSIISSRQNKLISPYQREAHVDVQSDTTEDYVLPEKPGNKRETTTHRDFTDDKESDANDIATNFSNMVEEEEYSYINITTVKKTIVVKLRVEEINIHPFLGIDGKTYKFNLPAITDSSADLFIRSVITKIKAKIAVPVDEDKLAFNIGYYDEDGDFIIIDPAEDMQMVKSSSSYHTRQLYLVLQITNSPGSSATPTKPLLDLFLQYFGNIPPKAWIWSSVGIMVVVMSRFMLTPKH